MAKAKQVVKTFVSMMAEITEDSWQAFLSKEENRLSRKFYPMGKNLGEESRMISYLNFICKNGNLRPKFQDSYKFFETWRQVSGYMPFEGRTGENPGVKADIALVNQGIQYFLEWCLRIKFEPSMTQEDWDLDEAYHYQKVFGAYAEPVSDDIPF